MNMDAGEKASVLTKENINGDLDLKLSLKPNAQVSAQFNVKPMKYCALLRPTHVMVAQLEKYAI